MPKKSASGKLKALAFVASFPSELRPVVEHRFHPVRKWRFDFAWPEHRVALEVEGGVWTGGRHTRGSGFVKDVEKYNAAGRLGWIVLRCVPSDLLKRATAELVVDTIQAR